MCKRQKKKLKKESKQPRNATAQHGIQDAGGSLDLIIT